ncbi:MAG: NAD(P)-dependent oxidoreductase [Acidobacteriota bacterium]
MTSDVLCLRPKVDFERSGALPPESLTVTYRGFGEPDVSDLMKRAAALVIPAVGPAVPSEWFEGTSLRLVQITGAGLDRLDRTTMERLAIPVANVPGGSNRAVAEYAVTSASVMLRRFAWADAEIRQGGYVSFRARMVADNLQGLDGLMVGVVGLGTIGLAVAETFHHMGCRICYFDPTPRECDATRAMGATALPLDQLLAASDVVSVHAPLVPATRGLLGDRELSLMKPGAVLVQASRGGVVDEQALAAHLRSGRLGGAAVDVYGQEPPPADHPLFALEGDAARRLLLTPHIGGVTRQSAALLGRSAWQNVERVLVAGQPPLNRAY